MAQRTQTIITDDIDGSDDAKTVYFSLDNVDYAIDLSEKHEAAFRESFAEWVGHAKKVSGKAPATRRSSGSSSSSSSRSSEELQKIRDWASSNGHEVAQRGRIKQSVVEAYEAAQG